MTARRPDPESLPAQSAILAAPRRAGRGGMSDSRTGEASRYSRREVIKRVIASGAVASAATDVSGGLQGCSSRGTTASAVSGSVARLIRINVNGQERPVDVLPQETLAMTLRYRLGLTGTKLSCDRAE